MMTYFSSRFILLAIASVAVLPASVSRVSAEVFRGRVEYRGVIVFRGGFTDLTARIRGTGLTASGGNQINYNASGIYEIGNGRYLGRYSGKLRTVANNQGKVVRNVQRRPIRVSRRKIRFADGTIRLKRPIRDLGPGRYRLRGRGLFRVSA